MAASDTGAFMRRQPLRSIEDARVVLLQLRKDVAMREHEYRNMLRSGHLAERQVARVDGLVEEFRPEVLEDAHLFIIGGSGDFSVFDELPFTSTLTQALIYCREADLPVLGSCWGGQFMAESLGGTVVTDSEHEETGSYLVFRSPASDTDPLFRGFPTRFWAQLGHHETIASLPPGAVALASTRACEIQAFTWPGSTQYGVQFHPELTREGLIERVVHYRDSYAADPAALDAIIRRTRPSPWTENLVGRFVEKIVLPRYATGGRAAVEGATCLDAFNV